jgi:hypothetical protein
MTPARRAIGTVIFGMSVPPVLTMLGLAARYKQSLASVI